MPTKLKEMFKQATLVYKNNFSKLFIPLMIFQLALLSPLLFFSAPGTISVMKSVVVSFALFDGNTLRVVIVLAVVAAVAVFFSPLVVCDVVSVIHSDYENKKASFKQAFLCAKSTYGKMLKTYFAAIALFIPIVVVSCLVIIPQAFVDGALIAAPTAGVIISAIVCGGAILFFMFGIVFVPYVVVLKEKGGFKAVFDSFKYAFLGDFKANFLRIVLAAGIVALVGAGINWLSQLPFKEVLLLYLVDPIAALREPLMIAAIGISLAAIIVITLVFPFWYAFSYGTYKNAKYFYEQKRKPRPKTLHGQGEY